LTFAWLSLVLSPPIQPCFADEAMTIEQLIINMQKAVDAIEDIIFTLKMTLKTLNGTNSNDEKYLEQVSHFQFKKHPLLVLRTDLPGHTKSLTRKVADKDYVTRYDPKTQELSKYEFASRNFASLIPHLGEDLETIKKFVDLKTSYNLERKMDSQGPYYVLSLKVIPDESFFVYSIREADWLIFKWEGFRYEQLMSDYEVKDVIINSGLTEDSFKLGADNSVSE